MLARWTERTCLGRENRSRYSWREQEQSSRLVVETIDWKKAEQDALKGQLPESYDAISNYARRWSAVYEVGIVMLSLVIGFLIAIQVAAVTQITSLYLSLATSGPAGTLLLSSLPLPLAFVFMIARGKLGPVRRLERFWKQSRAR